MSLSYLEKKKYQVCSTKQTHISKCDQRVSKKKT